MGAWKVTGLLRAVVLEVPVRPVLVLAGSGMPEVPAGAVREGARVLPAMSAKGWAGVLAE